MDFRGFARVTLSHLIDSDDPKTVGHVRPEGEDSMLLVAADSLQLFPTPLLQILVLKLYDILCGDTHSQGKLLLMGDSECISI